MELVWKYVVFLINFYFDYLFFVVDMFNNYVRLLLLGINSGVFQRTSLQESLRECSSKFLVEVLQMILQTNYQVQVFFPKILEDSFPEVPPTIELGVERT